MLDAFLKLMSIVLTIRHQMVLEKRYSYSFRLSPNIACPDGSFSLRSIRHMNKEHDTKSWVVFHDLVKAFDSIDHELIFELLKILVFLF